MKTITQAGLVATAMIGVSIVAAWGVMTGALDGDTPVRVMMVFNALILAYYGNAIPKAVLRTPIARAARRFAGWVFVLGGLISAALWAFVPLDIATPAAVTVTAGSAILAFSYCFLNRSRSEASE
ncbi:MAG: hypothetical protein KBA31_03705 [Alphaproteobacteria bacterium]|nr:hypothetical protein [Alphaproteobacteria bacterium]